MAPAVQPGELRAFLAERRTTYYVVRPGDTFERIGKLFDVDVAILAEVNQLSNESLVAGTRIIIPMKKG